MLLAGTYEFADPDSMCSNRALGGSALCINRTVTIEAEVAGSVVLDAKGASRVITVLSGTAAKLVGLNITGGAVLGRRQYTVNGGLYLRPGSRHPDTREDYSLQGGGILVEANSRADLEECNIFDNTAKDVCSTLSLLSENPS